MDIREYKEYKEDEILDLYTSVGWVAYTKDPDALRQGFGGSLLVLAAYERDGLAGLLRAVGDGHTVVYIQDILVRPEHQRRGIGAALLNAAVERYRGVRQILLMTDDTEASKAFYRSCGFREVSENGCCAFIYTGERK